MRDSVGIGCRAAWNQQAKWPMDGHRFVLTSPLGNLVETWPRTWLPTCEKAILRPGLTVMNSGERPGPASAQHRSPKLWLSCPSLGRHSCQAGRRSQQGHRRPSVRSSLWASNNKSSVAVRVQAPFFLDSKAWLCCLRGPKQEKNYRSQKNAKVEAGQTSLQKEAEDGDSWASRETAS